VRCIPPLYNLRGLWYTVLMNIAMPSETKPVDQVTTRVESGFMRSVVEDCIKKVEAGKATDGELVIVQEELDKKTILLNNMYLEEEESTDKLDTLRAYVTRLENLLEFGKPIEHFHEYDE